MALEDTQRFHDLLVWLHENGPIQIGVDALAEASGVPVRSLGRYTKRMEELSLLVITRRSTFGHGREHNHYRVLVAPDVFRRRLKSQQRERERERRKEIRDRERALRSEARRIAADEQVARELRELVEAAEAPDPVILNLEERVRSGSIADLSDDDMVDAWIGGAL